MRAGLVAAIVIVVVAVVAALNALFIVDPTSQALVLQFGEVKQRIREPGLNAKIPLIQDVLYLDKRTLDLNVPAQELIAADQKRLVVDAFLRYRIQDPELFYQTVNNVETARTRLATFVTGSLRAVLADATFQDIVRDDRAALMQRIKADVARNAATVGVEVIDVRIRRADLPEANSDAIYQRMKTAREQEATEIRAQGREAARRITAAADRTATVLRAEAQRESEQIRGQGDKQKNSVLASAYGVDPEFAAFYRTMQLYEAALQSNDTRLVLSPNADFFRYFNDPQGGRTPTPAAATPAGGASGASPAADAAAGVGADGGSVPPAAAPTGNGAAAPGSGAAAAVPTPPATGPDAPASVPTLVVPPVGDAAAPAGVDEGGTASTPPPATAPVVPPA